MKTISNDPSISWLESSQTGGTREKSVITSFWAFYSDFCSSASPPPPSPPDSRLAGGEEEGEKPASLVEHSAIWPIKWNWEREQEKGLSKSGTS